MKKKIHKINRKEEIRFIPLTHDVEKGKILIFNLFKSYPFNSKHRQYDFYLGRYVEEQFSFEIWRKIWNEMLKLGAINCSIVASSEIGQYIHEIQNSGYFDKRITISLVENIINYVIPKIPTIHTNSEYRETSLFSILKDYFFLLYSFLLPNGKSWIEYLSNPSVGDEYSYLFNPLSLKHLSVEWRTKIKETSTRIRNEYIIREFEREGTKIFPILKNNDRTGENLKKDTIKRLKSNLNKIEEGKSIPENYQSNISDVIQSILDNTGESIVIPETKIDAHSQLFYTHSDSSYIQENKFGLAPRIINDSIRVYHKENEIYEYELNSEVEIILTPEQFRNQLNEILRIFFGHANIQLDSDGILRYRQSKYEDLQVHTLIESFVSKKLSNLTQQLDILIIVEEKCEWKEIAKYSRILLEDYCREVLKRKKIKYSSDAGLVGLLKKLRENSKKLFKFPDWLTKDPFRYFDEYILSMRFMAVILNPNNHTDKLTVKRDEALTIKNSVISMMISLTGFLK